MTPTAFQAYVNWPVDTPNPYGGGGANFAGNMAGDDDIGEDDMERDDNPTQVHSATSTRSGDDGSDDWLRWLVGWEWREEDLKAHVSWVIFYKLSVNSFILIFSALTIEQYVISVCYLILHIDSYFV